MKKIITLILIVLLMVSIFPVSAFALLESSGSAGDNASYTFDSKTGTLVISPVDKSKAAKITLARFNNEQEIKHVEIKPGITEMESSVFYGCSNLLDVKIGSGLQRIGTYAFAYCYKLTTVDFPDSISFIGSHDVYDSAITTLVFRGAVPQLGSGAFETLGNNDAVNVYTAGGKSYELKGANTSNITFRNLSEYTGTMQSNGSVWIICAVFVVALAAVAVILNKKKKA